MAFENEFDMDEVDMDEIGRGFPTDQYGNIIDDSEGHEDEHTPHMPQGSIIQQIQLIQQTTNEMFKEYDISLNDDLLQRQNTNENDKQKIKQNIRNLSFRLDEMKHQMKQQAKQQMRSKKYMNKIMKQSGIVSETQPNFDRIPYGREKIAQNLPSQVNNNKNRIQKHIDSTWVTRTNMQHQQNALQTNQGKLFQELRDIKALYQQLLESTNNNNNVNTDQQSDMKEEASSISSHAHSPNNQGSRRVAPTHNYSHLANRNSLNYLLCLLEFPTYDKITDDGRKKITIMWKNIANKNKQLFRDIIHKANIFKNRIESNNHNRVEYEWNESVFKSDGKTCLISVIIPPEIANNNAFQYTNKHFEKNVNLNKVLTLCIEKPNLEFYSVLLADKCWKLIENRVDNNEWKNGNKYGGFIVIKRNENPSNVFVSASVSSQQTNVTEVEQNEDNNLHETIDDIEQCFDDMDENIDIPNYTDEQILEEETLMDNNNT